MEQKALDQLSLKEEVDRHDALQEELKDDVEPNFAEKMSENKELSLVLAVILGVVLFLIEKVMSSDFTAAEQLEDF